MVYKYHLMRCFGELNKVRVLSDSSSDITFINYVGKEIKVLKEKGKKDFFDTWEEAHGELLSYQLKKVAEARKSLLRTQRELEKVGNMKE